jgi:hypothetical protein
MTKARSAVKAIKKQDADAISVVRVKGPVRLNEPAWQECACGGGQ